MRRAMLVGAVALALGGPARAADLGVKLDDFDALFNARAEPLHADLHLSRPICASRTSCMLEAGADVVVALVATPDGDTVVEADVSGEAGSRASAARFAEACDGLVALLSPDYDAVQRGHVLSALAEGLKLDAVRPVVETEFSGGVMHYSMYRSATGLLGCRAARR